MARAAFGRYLAWVFSPLLVLPGGGTPSRVLVALPNGSRLSCGANAGGRKRPAWRYHLAGAQTSASSESRPRQLQALVRRVMGRRVDTAPRAKEQTHRKKW